MDGTPSQLARRRRKSIILQKKQRKNSLSTATKNASLLSSHSNENYSPNGSDSRIVISTGRGRKRIPLSTLSIGKLL